MKQLVYLQSLFSTTSYHPITLPPPSPPQVSKEKDSPVRIIDFGMVCKIPSPGGSYRGSVIQGR